MKNSQSLNSFITNFNLIALVILGLVLYSAATVKPTVVNLKSEGILNVTNVP